MRPLWGIGSACALLFVAADAGPARAAWNNVFQVCCASCGGQSSVSNYAPADTSCNPCPQVCTTRYVQRCYYQPVTSYESRSYYEAVTTYRTSYYYEPVTTYRYSCYYDPCTCSYQQVACPTTSYRLRSQCCPVQSWVQRCAQVPVTSYRMSSYWEPVTSCCTPQPACCPTSMTAPAAESAAVAPATQAPPAAQPQPGVAEQRSVPQQPAVQETPGASGSTGTGSGSPLYDRYYSPPNSPSKMPGVEGSSLRNAPPRRPTTLPPAAPVAPPTVRLDRVVSVQKSTVAGQLVRSDRLPQSGARVMFVSVAPQGAQQQVTTDATGQFRVTLASGGWLVYVDGADHKPAYHSKLEVKENETRQVTLLSH